MSQYVYVVVCYHPDGGDVIDGRAPPVRSYHTDYTAAIDDARSWYRGGPNGPVRSARVLQLVNGAEHELDPHFGPPCPCTLRAYRLFDGWWHCSAQVRGREGWVRATAGHDIYVTASEALLNGEFWAEMRGYEVTESEVAQ